VTRVLVFTRGEIAVRACLAARRLGLTSVLVLTPADEDGAAARVADDVYPCPRSEPAHSFLDLDFLQRAVRDVEAAAVYPGYGFLAESEALARAVVDAGALFVGPSPATLAVLGDKARAIELARRAGLADLRLPDGPVSDGGFPLMLKATRGGGGRGNLLVESASALASAEENLRLRAQALFRNGELVRERFLPAARHVELQLFGFGDLGVRVLGTRDCSLQRGHQKIVEEGPAPSAAARALAPHLAALERELSALGYRGAGTLELLWDPQAERLYFLEANARIQVEHPVTEMLLGVDLVEWQLRETLGLDVPALFQRDLPERGHAVEARLYAESPLDGFVPEVGRIHHLHLPTPPMCRWDLGVCEGSAVTPHYDPLLGKLIAWGQDRQDALARLAGALDEATLQGVRTNLDLLAELARHPDVMADVHSTRWIERSFLPTLAAPALPGPVPASLSELGRALGPPSPPARSSSWKSAHRR
jgi:acetyl/propionyl-CoA carboxylase alpha subunit